MIWRLALLLVFATRTWACMCGGTWPSVKQAWQQADAVFLGTVELADPNQADGSNVMFQPQYVRILVDEAFKGVAAGQVLELHQAGGSCSAKFQTGTRAVYYFFKGRDGGWSVASCFHSTGNPDPDGDDLLFLHSLPESAHGTRISGEVRYYETSPTAAFRKVGGVHHVPVRILGPNGELRRTETNSAGAYVVQGLPPGRYSVQIDVPRGKHLTFPTVEGAGPIAGDPAAVDLGPDSGVNVSFVLQDDTRITGVVLDAEGAPMIGVCVDLVDMDELARRSSQVYDCTKADGAFTLRNMPPGKYRIVARDYVKFGGFRSQSTLYYPGVRDRRRSSVIAVEEGGHLENYVLQQPTEEKRFELSGRIQFADGVPVPGAAVIFESALQGYAVWTSSRADGAFTLSVPAGMRGALSGSVFIPERVWRSCPEFSGASHGPGLFATLDTNPVALSMGFARESVIVEVPAPSCRFYKRD